MGHHAIAFGGGNAAATLTNSGSITIAGMANASGNAAFAAGVVFGGLRQSATATGQYATITTFGGGTGAYTPGGNATASLTNSGKIMVVGHANAVGTTGAASAVALVGGGLVQSARAPWRRVCNSSQFGLVYSGCSCKRGWSQDGPCKRDRIGWPCSGSRCRKRKRDGFDYERRFDRYRRLGDRQGQGRYRVLYLRFWNGNDGSTVTIHYANPVAATAINLGGVVQEANATNGNATASLTNSGSIMIAAVANASGAGASLATASGTVVAGVDAFAQVGEGILQTAFAAESSAGTAHANASASLTNSGKITIAAAANANNTGIGTADASAIVSGGMVQAAQALNGNASAAITNSGAIAIQAAATANAVHTAYANALVSGGIAQSAIAGGAGHSASANLTNSGTIQIQAVGNAVGGDGAYATAAVFGGLSQTVFAASGPASAVFSNVGAATVPATGTATTTTLKPGTFSVLAKANATAAKGSANANVSATGVVQSAAANNGNANATINNSGTIDIAGVANAVSGGNAHASAFIAGAFQFANASGWS